MQKIKTFLKHIACHWYSLLLCTLELSSSRVKFNKSSLETKTIIDITLADTIHQFGNALATYICRNLNYAKQTLMQLICKYTTACRLITDLTKKIANRAVRLYVQQ